MLVATNFVRAEGRPGFASLLVCQVRAVDRDFRARLSHRRCCHLLGHTISSCFVFAIELLLRVLQQKRCLLRAIHTNWVIPVFISAEKKPLMHFGNFTLLDRDLAIPSQVVMNKPLGQHNGLIVTSRVRGILENGASTPDAFHAAVN